MKITKVISSKNKKCIMSYILSGWYIRKEDNINTILEKVIL